MKEIIQSSGNEKATARRIGYGRNDMTAEEK